MANEVEIFYSAGGTLYFLVFNDARQVYNGTAFENVDTSRWIHYANIMTESNIPGRYYGDFPSVAAGTYAVSIYFRATGAPAYTDLDIGDGELVWNGFTEATLIPITISFMDSGHSVIPYVTFDIVGLGETSTLATGHVTLSVQAGTYTVRANPTNNVIWDVQTIIVTSENTVFDIIGQPAVVFNPTEPPTPPRSTAKELNTIVVNYNVSWMFSFEDRVSLTYTLTNADTTLTETYTQDFPTSYFYIGVTPGMGPDQIKEQIIGNFLELTRVDFYKFARKVLATQQGFFIGSTLGGLTQNTELHPVDSLRSPIPSQNRINSWSQEWTPYAPYNPYYVCGTVSLYDF